MELNLKLSTINQKEFFTKDYQKKINEMLQKQFLIEKWGEMPSIFMEETPPTENNTTKIKTGSNNKAVEINNIVETNYNNKIETKKRRLT